MPTKVSVKILNIDKILRKTDYLYMVKYSYVGFA